MQLTFPFIFPNLPRIFRCKPIELNGANQNINNKLPVRITITIGDRLKENIPNIQNNNKVSKEDVSKYT